MRLHAHDPGRYPHFLESVAQGAPQARYDILFGFPGPSLRLTADGLLQGNTKPIAGGFLEALDQIWRDHKAPNPSALPFPFSGG